MRYLITLFSLVFILSCTKNENPTIAYQSMANPWKLLIKNETIDKKISKKIDWKQFDSGAKVIQAMASGDVDMAVVGSTPAAAAISQGLPLKIVWVMEIIGESEALVAQKEIKTLEDLKGKKVATPFGSTTHYHLLIALKNAGIKKNEVELLNLTPAGIVSSFKNNNIDAAFVWGPSLEEIKKTGNTLLSSKDLALKGDPNFDAVIVRSDFIKGNEKLIENVLGEINSLHLKYNENKWTEDSEEIEVISKFLGSEANDIFTSLKGYSFPTQKEQLSFLQTSAPHVIKRTSEFLKDQGRVSSLLDNYDVAIDSNFAKNL